MTRIAVAADWGAAAARTAAPDANCHKRSMVRPAGACRTMRQPERAVGARAMAGCYFFASVSQNSEQLQPIAKHLQKSALHGKPRPARDAKGAAHWCPRRARRPLRFAGASKEGETVREHSETGRLQRHNVAGSPYDSGLTASTSRI